MSWNRRRHHPVAAQRDQALCRRARDRGCRFRPAPRRDPCAGRRERRRQIDADQGDGRRGDADFGLDAGRRRRRHAAHAAGGAPSRHRHGVPGEQPGADHDGGAEPVSRPGEILQPAARHLHRRAAVPAIAQFRRHADRDGRPARRRQEADGRDRARGAAPGQGHHLRRADRDADAGGEEILLRPGARPEDARRLDRLHLARAGGGAAARRPHHRAARRQARGDRRRRQIRPCADRAGDGRPRSVQHALRHAQDDGAAARRAGADRAEPENGADGEATIRCRSSPARSPACSAWSAPAAPRRSRSSPAC